MADEPHVESVPVKLGDATIQLKIDPAQVNQTIAAAILSSGIGDLVKKHADEFLNNQKTGWGEVGLKKAVGEEMAKMVIEMCQETEIREEMRKKIREAISEGLIDRVVHDALKASLKQIEDRMKRGY
jgi:hypothetical protein